MKAREPCSEQRLRDLLRSGDEDEEYRRTAAHLESCRSCQQRLEQLAASPEDWHEVQEVFARDTRSVAQDEDAPMFAYADRPRPRAWSDSMAEQLLSPPRHPEMLGRIGRYDVERLIGAGGMGVVFKAFDTELHRPVAIKVLAPYLAGSGAARQRFAREARAAAAVVHEHVVPIHNVESDGAATFLVMPFVSGESLQQRLDREGPLELCEILRIGMQTAAGLAAAHAQGLVHRDVKPANILLEQGVERALLTDFGLARANDDASLTHSGYHPGTPQFMSPEQARGDAVDARSDLFSLGSVLYAMSCGRPPFRSDSSYGILRKITDIEPRRLREVNPAIPEWLERIVHGLLSKSPEQRPQTAEQVERLLKTCLAHVQQPAAMALPKECRSPVLRPTGKSLFASALMLGLLVPLTGFCIARFSAWEGSQPESKKQQQAPVEHVIDRARAEEDWNAATRQIESFDADLSNFQQQLQEHWPSIPQMNLEKTDTTSPTTR